MEISSEALRLRCPMLRAALLRLSAMTIPDASSAARLILLPDAIFSNERSNASETDRNAFPADWLKVLVLIDRDMAPPVYILVSSQTLTAKYNP
jgi:hypothetical protein